ncbi:MAG: CDP-alcohol phosphatidyltransferase family protein [Planctomycetes bacterium]|nr:CDP-alcohol phosphatidyltransferase family protein [Planctomycetota bacterium]
MEIHKNVLLPNLVTAGNGICGFWALTKLFKLGVVEGGTPLEFNDPHLLATAAWLVLLGMVFDVFDGKVARMYGGASTLGAQLDSLCDLVTFGVVPAVLMHRINLGYTETWWQRIVFLFCLVYFLCAMLRLARFTAENDPDDSAHMAFKGLPSPGAAGCVASLVIFFCYVSEFREKELQWVSRFVEPQTLKGIVAYIPWLLPPLGLVLGLTMISSRLRFDHVGSRVLNRKHSFDYFACLVFAIVLIAVLPEIVLPAIFLGYLVYSPARALLAYLLPARAPKVEQDGAGP